MNKRKRIFLGIVCTYGVRHGSVIIKTIKTQLEDETGSSNKSLHTDKFEQILKL